MSLRCLFGLHRVSPASILRRDGGLVAICESCARPMERRPGTAWVASEPLDQRRDRAA